MALDLIYNVESHLALVPAVEELGESALLDGVNAAVVEPSTI